MKNNPNLSRLSLISFVICFSLTANLFGQPETLWKTKFKKKVNWLKLAPTGHLIVSTGDGLLGVDPDSGKVLWKNKGLKGVLARPRDWTSSWLQEFIPFTPYAVVKEWSGAHKTFKHSGMPHYFRIFNFVTGEDHWNAESLNISEDYGYYFLPEVGGMLIYAKNKSKQKTVLMVELKTGNVMWENQEFFKAGPPALFKIVGRKHWDRDAVTVNTIVGNQVPVFDTKETMITIMNSKAIRKFNARTGEQIWEIEIDASGVPALKYGYAPMALTENRDVVFVPCARTVYAVRSEYGTLVWEETPKLKGMVARMKLTPHGLVVMGKDPRRSRERGVVHGPSAPFISLLDLGTGQPLWTRVDDELKSASDFVIKGDQMVVCTDEKLFSLDLNDGTPTEIAADLAFTDNETPASMLLRDDGYFLQSQNDLMLVSFDGEQVFHSYFEAPQLNDEDKFFGGLGRFFMDVLTVSMEQSGWTTDYQEKNRLYNEWFPLEKRFEDTTNLETYTYILAEIKAGKKKRPGLVKVNKMNGEIEDQIILGTKKPAYEVDEIESRLFFKSSKKEIVCYKF